MTIALACPRCGAPLPPAVQSSPFVPCAYCGVTVSAGAAGVAVVPNRPEGPRAELPQSAAQVFGHALAEALAAGVAPYEALRAAAERHLGVLGRGDAVAKITLSLAAEFDAA